MNFNLNHYSNVYHNHPKNEIYCFPLRMFLGKNGLFENHELKGKIFLRKENGEEYFVDDVYVHWFKGWYFVALARDKGNSHTSISWNINSDLEDFKLDLFKLKYGKI